MGDVNNRISDLIIRHLEETITPIEAKELQDWASRSAANQALLDELTDPDQLADNLRELYETRSAIWNKVNKRIREEQQRNRQDQQRNEQDHHRSGQEQAPYHQQPPVIRIQTDTLHLPYRRRASMKWGYAAACILFLMMVGGTIWWFTRQGSASTPEIADKRLTGNDISPGGNRATLRLADGTTIALDSARHRNSVVAHQGQTNIIQSGGGQLAYQALTADAGTRSSDANASGLALNQGTNTNGPPSANLSYNVLATPRAGQFSVVLPDGSKVWLNNASALRYPTSFNGMERVVELYGEAYFEIAPLNAIPGHSPPPFKVYVVPSGSFEGTAPVNEQNQMLVEVLGTHFNIMSYEDEKAIRATLLEGKVRVSAGAGHQVVLRPGEQIGLGTDGDWKLAKNIQEEEVLDWKNGFFHFNHAGLHDVMRQLARWYDIDVEFRGGISEGVYEGEIKRNLTLIQVLDNLGTDIHYRIEGRKVIITP